MSWYFAYGSNMNAKRLFDDRLVPEGVPAGARIAGRLDGWRLAFNKRARAPVGSGAGNIVMAAGESVYGTLNWLPEAGFVVLDRYEGVAGGHYERRTVAVSPLDGGAPVEAITYVALLTAENLRPTRAYLAHLLAGHDLLPAEYCRRLAATQTLD
ncbi:MAG: gamma-glutamylcyclotransferase [Reyranellaceae bacterium]